MNGSKALIFGASREGADGLPGADTLKTLAGGSLVIAADGGYHIALEYGIRPDVWIGDFDSSAKPSEPPPGTEIVGMPAEKDLSDLQACIDFAVGRGCGEITLVCCTGGRLDHFLGNVFLLEYIHELGKDGRIVNRNNDIRYYSGGGRVSMTKDGYKYLSVIAADSEVAGVNISGVKYPLSDAVIKRASTLGVSNEITGGAAEIEIKSGAAFIIRSGDGDIEDDD